MSIPVNAKKVPSRNISAVATNSYQDSDNDSDGNENENIENWSMLTMISMH